MAQVGTSETPNAQERVPNGHQGRPATATGVTAPKRDPKIVGVGVYARPAKSRWQRLRGPIYAILIICLLAVSVPVASGIWGQSNVFTIQIENEQPVTLDLRAAKPHSPYVFGVNAFPSSTTVSKDGTSGFMLYGAAMDHAISTMGVTMLRFPGGTWGEQHTLSLDQVDAFLRMAKQVNAQPLLQVRLSGGTPQEAAQLVNYTNVANSPERAGRTPGPAMRVKYWVIGNEPDLIGSSYTVADYVRDFIAYATAMKSVDPTIQILGPEISQYNGPDAPPMDAGGTPWLDGFLRGVAQYEAEHNVRLLDGVTIHRYPFGSSVGSVGLLFSSSEEWRYLIPLLQTQIQQDMGHSLPIGVTEINTSALNGTEVTQAATALWWADTIGTLMEQGVAYVDFFGLQGVGQPYMLLNATGNSTPLSRVMELYRHMGSETIPVGAAANPVAVYASTTSDRSRLTLMVINKSSSTAALDIQPHGTFTGWPTVHTTIPAYSILCVTLSASQPAQTYLYAPPPSASAGNHGDAGVIVKAPLP